MDWLNDYPASPPTISTASEDGIGAEFRAITSWTASAWPVANQAMFVPILIHDPITIVKLSWVNGGTVSGNIDVGLYDPTGKRLTSAGSTAQSGINAHQIADVTDVTLTPGLYYAALALSNTTGIVFRCTAAGTPMQRVMGVYTMASAFALPDPATFAVAGTNTTAPLIGLHQRTTV